jgi:hypothetical protein
MAHIPDIHVHVHIYEQEDLVESLRAELAAKDAEIEAAKTAMGAFDLDPNFPATPPPTPEGEPTNANP